MRFRMPWSKPPAARPAQAGVRVIDSKGQVREQFGNDIFTEIGGGVPTVSQADGVSGS